MTIYCCEHYANSSRYLTDQPPDRGDLINWMLPTPPARAIKQRRSAGMQAVKGVDLTQSICAIKRQCKAKLQPLWDARRQAQASATAGCAPEIVETFKAALLATGDAWETDRQAGCVIECIEQVTAKQMLSANLHEAVIITDVDRVCDLFEQGGTRAAAYSRSRPLAGFDLLAMTEDDALRMQEPFGAYCVVLAGVCTSTAEHVQRLFRAVCPVVVCC